MNKIFCLLIMTLFSFSVLAHDNEKGVSLESKLPSTSSAGKIRYAFDLYDNANKKNLTDSDLILSHEKLIHLFVFDLALKEFRHVHPSFINDEWTAEFDLNQNGQYMVWVEGTLNDGDEFSAFEKISIVNGKEANKVPASLGDVRQGSEGNSVISLTGIVKAKKSSMLTATFTRNDGTQADIKDYLGAFAHFVAVPLDGSALIHVHPMSTGKPNEGMIHATFPNAGDYRLWAQFMDGETLRIVPLSINVQ